MKILKYLPLLFAFLWACSSEKSYHITGKITDDVNQVYLEKRVDGEFVKVDSAAVLNGTFELTGHVDAADIYYVASGSRSKKMIFLENEEYHLGGDSIALNDASIEGGTVQSQYNSFEESQAKLWDILMTKYKAIGSLETEAEKVAANAEVDSLYEIHTNNQSEFIENNANSPISVYLLSRIQYGMDAEELGGKVAMLDSTLSSMETYKWLVDRVEVLKKVAVGMKAPDFEQADADGNMIKFSDVYSANKYTLVDFWASWCGPCRQENPNVVEAFKKFNKKGFTVFGVSLDSNKERWLKAIEDDGLTWAHVSDLSGWKNAAAADYGVNSIPANFLVDQNGVILGTGLREAELHEKLGELLN